MSDAFTCTRTMTVADDGIACGRPATQFIFTCGVLIRRCEEHRFAHEHGLTELTLEEAVLMTVHES